MTINIYVDVDDFYSIEVDNLDDLTAKLDSVFSNHFKELATEKQIIAVSLPQEEEFGC